MASRSAPPTLPSPCRIVAYTLQGATLVLLVSVLVVLWTVDASTLAAARGALEVLETWSAPAIHETVAGVAAELALGLGKVAQPLRVAVSGRAATPGIDVTLCLVGRGASLRRIDQAIAYIEAHAID